MNSEMRMEYTIQVGLASSTDSNKILQHQQSPDTVPLTLVLDKLERQSGLATNATASG